VTAVTCASGIPTAAVAPTSLPAASGPAPRTLLPPPATGEADDLTALLLVQAQNRKTNAEGALRQVGAARERSRQLLQQAHRELERAARAERREQRRHRTGRLFLGIAKVAAIVASVAATVVSFGSAAPLAAIAIAGVVLSMSGQVLGETRALQSLGMSDRAAAACTIGLSTAGTVLSAGAGAAAALGSTADGASAACEAVSTAATVARGVEGGARAAAAAYEERAAHWQEVAANAETSAVASNQSEDRLQAQILRLIADLEQAEASVDRATEALATAIDTQASTVTVAGGVTWTA